MAGITKYRGEQRWRLVLDGWDREKAVRAWLAANASGIVTCHIMGTLGEVWTSITSDRRADLVALKKAFGDRL